MSLDLPIIHSCHIKCPICKHKFLYEFKIQDIDKVISKEKSQDIEVKYKFDTYLICKNPLCNYDIQIKGNVFECPLNILKNVDIYSIK